MPIDHADALLSGSLQKEVDTVVYGAGVVGYAAARRLAASGERVLLVDFAADLLWEATRALENEGAAREGSPAWNDWLASLAPKKGWDGAFIEPAMAEILTAEALLKTPRLSALFYAMPVSAHVAEGALRAVTVATKSGFHILSARSWVDATEEGDLLKLCGWDLAVRNPAIICNSMVLYSPAPEDVERVLPQLNGAGQGLELLRSLKPGERRLRWKRGEERWHKEMLVMAQNLRELAKTEQFEFAITHCGSHSFPVYSAAAEPALPAGIPGNLTVLSPGLRSEALERLADRFDLGDSINPSAVKANARPVKAVELKPTVIVIPVETEAREVVVAGAGTAGAIAAIAAARSGAKTLAFDLSLTPGGMGTGGGVIGYFHGAQGGIQSEIDRRSGEISEIFTGARPVASSWHHDAKKIALLEGFEQCGVEFLSRALLCGVEKDAEGRVRAALVGRQGVVMRLPATAWIDGTGDGDLSAMAGAQYLYGRAGDRRPMAFTQVGFWISSKTSLLKVIFSNYDAGWVDPSDAADLTRARLVGLSQYLSVEQREEEHLVAMAPLLGVRQSRQIEADRMVTLTDMVAGAEFEDAIGAVDSVADTHSVDFEFESDELAFYYWSCRGFRHRLHCDLPYRMLLPKGLTNVWIACRAAGISMEANTGLRMQREMQRLGEAAGAAAALSLACGGESRKIKREAFFATLDRTGARSTRPKKKAPMEASELLAMLDEGKPGVYLWHLYQRWSEVGEEAVQRLHSHEPRVSFYAAALCAMAGDRRGAQRLTEAVQRREIGPTPEEFRVKGAYGQCIDIPFWLQGVIFLRRIGEAESLPAIAGMLEDECVPFNVLTSTALTLERIAGRIGAHPLLAELLNRIAALCPADTVMPPSRSLWRTLTGESQQSMPNVRGATIRDDHRWQLDLVLHRTRALLGIAAPSQEIAYEADERGVVRKAFAAARSSKALGE